MEINVYTGGCSGRVGPPHKYNVYRYITHARIFCTGTRVVKQRLIGLRTDGNRYGILFSLQPLLSRSSSSPFDRAIISKRNFALGRNFTYTRSVPHFFFAVVYLPAYASVRVRFSSETTPRRARSRPESQLMPPDGIV